MPVTRPETILLQPRAPWVELPPELPKQK